MFGRGVINSVAAFPFPHDASSNFIMLTMTEARFSILLLGNTREIVHFPVA